MNNQSLTTASSDITQQDQEFLYSEIMAKVAVLLLEGMAKANPDPYMIQHSGQYAIANLEKAGLSLDEAKNSLRFLLSKMEVFRQQNPMSFLF